MRRPLVRVLLVVAPLVSSSCGGRAEDAVGARAPTLYTATAQNADGERASMALLADDSTFAAYVCSDDPAADGYSGWFRGALAADGPSHVERDGWMVVAERAANSVEVAVTSPDGDTLRFDGARANADGLTGLYAADNGACTTGVIVLGGRDEPLVRGASCDEAGRLMQVTPARPLELVDGALPVEVKEHRMLVAPLRSVRP